jgi:hypothetical protein
MNTDGPELYRTNVYKEQELLRKAHILTPQAITKCNHWAFEASFLTSPANPESADSGGFSKADSRMEL